MLRLILYKNANPFLGSFITKNDYFNPYTLIIQHHFKLYSKIANDIFKFPITRCYRKFKDVVCNLWVIKKIHYVLLILYLFQTYSCKTIFLTYLITSTTCVPSPSGKGQGADGILFHIFQNLSAYRL